MLMLRCHKGDLCELIQYLVIFIFFLALFETAPATLPVSAPTREALPAATVQLGNYYTNNCNTYIVLAYNDVTYACLTAHKCRYQCDQMARLFVQYLAMWKNETLPNSIYYFPK